MIYTTARDLSAVAKAVLPHVCKDSVVGWDWLKTVRFEVERGDSGAKLVAVATDRYSLGVARTYIPAESESESFCISTDDAKDLLNTIGAGKSDVVLDVALGLGEVYVNNEFAYELVDDKHYPNWRKTIVAQLDETELEGPMEWWIQPPNLIRFKNVGDPMVRMRWVHPHKAIYITSEKYGFEGLVMPGERPIEEQAEPPSI